MIPVLLKKNVLPGSSFTVTVDDGPCFFDRYHYHPEIELVIIDSGTGTLTTGSYQTSFMPGDVFLLGSNLPHCFRSNDSYYQPGMQLRSKATVIHFDINCMGVAFWSLPETKEIYLLLQKAKSGIRIAGDSRLIINKLMHDLISLEGPRRISTLIGILAAIAWGSQLTVLEMKDNDLFRDNNQ